MDVEKNNTVKNLTSGRLLARNTFLNVIGQGAPLLVAIFSIPFLIKAFGTERFGLLTLAWMVIGYFGLFDLGLGRALTKVVAEKLGAGEEEKIPALFWTSLFLMLILGMAGALTMFWLSPWLVHDVIKISVGLQSEALNTFLLLSVSIPLVITATGLRGFLQAKQLFGYINAIRVPLGIFSYAGPLLVIPFSTNIFHTVVLLLAARVVAWIVYLIVCLRVMPELRRQIVFQRSVITPLISLGGWMTVSNIIGPLMVYLDRFLIGAIISITAVAYYTTPYEVVTKLWLIPAALVGVLFPAFSTSYNSDNNRTVLLFERGVKYIFIALFPITLLVVSLAHEGIDLWLGSEFADNCTYVLQLLAVGVFINSFAHIPFALIQGAGRPDITAKLHAAELPFYLIFLWWMVGSYGIEGAAIAWLARVTVDTLFLFVISNRILPGGVSKARQVSPIIAAAVAAFIIALLPMSVTVKGIFLMTTILAFILIVWFILLKSEERAFVQNSLKMNFAPIER